MKKLMPHFNTTLIRELCYRSRMSEQRLVAELNEGDIRQLFSAGEMLQDLKVGHILGGTPSRMQIGDIFGIVIASLVLFFPLMVLDNAYHFGSPQLSAPQAGLMAMLAQGIVGGSMAWPLVVVGILMGLSLILIEVRSPMLFSVGMYINLETTFAIFVGGLLKGLFDRIAESRKLGGSEKEAMNISVFCWHQADRRRGVHRRRERGACSCAQSGHRRVLQGTWRDDRPTRRTPKVPPG
jgi:hypothetical protein